MGRPPPIIRAMPERKRFFSIEVFPKVILSACSPFFKRLLKTHTHPQPLVYLRRTKFVNLIAMVDFIYTGEVNILQDHLESFLAFAEELELKGLGGNSEGDTSRSQNEMFIPKEENGTFFHLENFI